MLLTPNLTKVRVDPAVIRSALCADMEAPILREIQTDAGSRPNPAIETSSRPRRHPARTSQLQTHPRHLAAPPAAQRRLPATTPPRAHSPPACSRSRALTPSNTFSGSSPGGSSARKCFDAAAPIKAGCCLGALVADARPAARSDHLVARMDRDRRGRALETAPLLRRTELGARQHPPSRRRTTARTRDRNRSRGIAGAERRISGAGRHHRTHRRDLRAGGRRGRRSAIGASDRSGLPSPPRSPGDITSAIATGPTCVFP